MNTKIEKQFNSPPKPEIRHRSWWFEIILGILILGFGILAFFARQYPYFPVDVYITQTIQLIDAPFFSELMVFMTTLGYLFQGSILVLLGSIGLILWNKKKDAAMLVASTGGAVLIGILFKLIISRPRPDPNLIHQLAMYTSHDSFPSGHVLFFLGFMGYLLYLAFIYLPKGIIQTVTVLIAFLGIILMGMSRIYLGAHWFSDTLGAYLIGTSWLFIIIWLRHRFVDFPSKNRS